MDQSTLREIETRCTQEAPPRCQTACPFQMDVRTFMTHLAAEKKVEARKLLERHIPLPHIMARICDHPCESACIRRDLGGGLAVRDLERFCVDHTDTPRTLPRPPKDGRVSVFGNGLAALVVAYDLSRKGYQITVYHEGDPESGLMRRYSELETASFALPDVTFVRCTPDAALLRQEQETGVVFVDADTLPTLAPSRETTDPDTLLADDLCCGGWLSTTPTGHVFASASQQAGEGRRAAVTLQRLLEGVSLTAAREETDKPGESRLHARLDGIVPEARILPSEELFSAEEAQNEAGRCIRCTCLSCVRECVFLQKYRSFPRAYARQINNNMSIVKGQHLANRIVNACALCGQCTEICPERFSMADLCLSARQDMVERAYMPPSAHDFALKDMADASGPAAFTLADENVPGATDCLFPGCQLPASRPDQTVNLYALMRPLWRDRGGLSLMQSCCGVPAYWAGNQRLFEEHIATLRELWITLGRPRLLMACASCLKTFRDALPDIPVCGLWEELDAVLPASSVTSMIPSPLTVHDPCAARHDDVWQQAVRSLAHKHGIELREPRLTGKTTACCGYGGGVWNAQPDTADAMSAHRAEDLAAHDPTSKGQALTSCSMCRDRLARSMPAWHILDVILPGDETGIPGLSARRVNRQRFRTRMLGEQPEEAGSLKIAPDVLARLERRFILRSDMEEAVRGVESTGAFFLELTSGQKLGAWRPGNVTFWVRYSVDATDSTTLHDGWCHRMRVPGASQPHEDWKHQPRRLDKA